MEGLKRCPRCWKLPDVYISKEDLSFTLQCKQHPGYIAQGKNEKQVTDFWNQFVIFVQGTLI